MKKMVNQVFSIYDEKGGFFGKLWLMNKKGQAIRAFSDLVNDDREGQIKKHPDDYKLYKLGVYDDNSGKIESTPQPEYICAGLDFMQDKNPQEKG